ncbi:class I SAM-dependent methyltransferase [Lentzea californiensis]|uniref:class I SAM-dependent methyltransferase n=1 Tax=Lentzea californiensis TaxID=438851 RepID=UPI00216527C6|nr:class I SAM-dependent methyltransferase [Lentzea californiensis]
MHQLQCNRIANDELGLKPGNAVLDIGCGSGALIPALVEAVGPQGRVVAELREVFERVEPVFAAEGETTTVVVATKVMDTATRSARTPSRPAE